MPCCRRRRDPGRPAPLRRRRRVHGRAVRQRVGRRAPRGRRGPGLRRLPGHRRAVARHRRWRRATSHVPRDRRSCPWAGSPRSTVPSPDRGASASPSHAHGGLGRPGGIRRRITSGPVASLKIASGCDRRCAFCAIPSFRGSFAFVPRSRADVVAEARWLAGDGVRELVLVSELHLLRQGPRRPTTLEDLLADSDRYHGDRADRLLLQPAEVRPGRSAPCSTRRGSRTTST